MIVIYSDLLTLPTQSYIVGEAPFCFYTFKISEGRLAVKNGSITQAKTLVTIAAIFFTLIWFIGCSSPYAYITNSADGDGTVSVIDTEDDTASVIDTATNTVIETIPVGIWPWAMGKFIGPYTLDKDLGS